jgi:hypothetical protein
MPALEPLFICDDLDGKHVWAEPFTDGDTCACGRFFLDLHPKMKFRAVIIETAPDKQQAAREGETE